LPRQYQRRRAAGDGRLNTHHHITCAHRAGPGGTRDRFAHRAAA
jgi:hypothetical protein